MSGTSGFVWINTSDMTSTGVWFDDALNHSFM